MHFFLEQEVVQRLFQEVWIIWPQRSCSFEIRSLHVIDVCDSSIARVIADVQNELGLKWLVRFSSVNIILDMDQ